MKKLITIMIILGSTLGLLGQDPNEANIEVPKRHFNYEDILSEEMDELKSLVQYFKTLAVDTTVIDSNLFRANLSSLSGISSRYLVNLNTHKDSIQEIIKTGNIKNSETFQDLVRDTTSLNVLIRNLQEAVDSKRYENIMKYFQEVRAMEDSIKTLNKIIKEENVLITDTIPHLRNRITIQHQEIINLNLNIDTLSLKLGEYRHNLFTWGISATGFYDPIGIYEYEVQADSTVSESQTADYGGMLSFVVIGHITTWEKGELYGIVNVSFAEFSAASESPQMFNKKMPLGLGFAYHRSGSPFLFTVMINYINTSRLSAGKRSSKDFGDKSPGEYLSIKDYAGSIKNINKFSVNIGVIIPINGLPFSIKRYRQNQMGDIM